MEDEGETCVLPGYQKTPDDIFTTTTATTIYQSDLLSFTHSLSHHSRTAPREARRPALEVQKEATHLWPPFSPCLTRRSPRVSQEVGLLVGVFRATSFPPFSLS